VGAGLQESSKGNLDYIVDTCNRAIEAGASRLMLADSLGSLSPFGMKFLVERVNQHLNKSVPIVVHCHNSFGQATMNACAAVTGGAAGVHVAANGLGLHGGLSSLEETVVALEMLFGLSTGIQTEKLYDFCTYVERVTGVTLPRHRAVVGDYNFVYETEADVLEVLNGVAVGEL
jgi:isopropylmalate/homocitrate/citramalate synthase